MAWRCNRNRHDCDRLFASDSFIVFDTETTGLHPEKGDRIIQMSALKLRPVDNQLGILDKLNVYIKPPFPISEKITEITGITNTFLKDKPSEEEIFDKIYEFFGDNPIVAAYNTPFDVAMTQALYQRHGKMFLPEFQADILEMARDFVSVKHVENFKQETIAKLYGLDKDLQFHNAEDDVLATARLLKTMRYEYLTHPECRGTKRPWMGPIYFLDYRWDSKGLYVFLRKDIRLFYSQFLRGWTLSNDKEADVGHVYDMEYIQRQVLRRLGFFDISEVQKLTKNQFDEMDGLVNAEFQRRAM